MTPYQPGEPMLTMGEEVEEVDEAAGAVMGGMSALMKGAAAAKTAKTVSTAAKIASAASALAPVAKASVPAGAAAAAGAAGGYALGKKKNQQEEVENVGEAAAWTRKAGKNKEGGLNEKGRKSYERENPGSDLKAPSKKVGNKRRASFCARMKGMKKKLTSAKTANDPDSRINKSLRAWNC
jgi:hypothetical protein